MPKSYNLSVVVPVFNERDNLEGLVADIVREVDALGLTYEVILVNDGSTDGSDRVLDALAEQYPQVKVVHFAHNCGQTLALAAGMDESSGKVIVTLDADRQNDPSDIGKLLDKLDEGYDCVSGWRKDRKDPALRRLVSRVANRIIHRLAAVPVHDLGCTLKAYRAEAVDPRELFGEMHRFLPLYVMARNGRVAELVVKHHRRAAGQSKYGFGRIPRVISDIVLVRLLLEYRTRPSHLFAKLAQHLALAGAAVFVLGVLLELLTGWRLWPTGFVAGVVMMAGSVNLLGIGWACELVMRNRYPPDRPPPWVIARKVNFERNSTAGGEQN